MMLLASASAYAQLDSSSAVLLRSGSKSSSPSKQSLDSSRYKIRAPESRKDDDDLDERPGTVIPTPVPSKSVTVKSSATATTKDSKSQTTTTLQVTNEPPPAKEAVPAPVPTAEPTTVAPAPVPTPTTEAPAEEKRPPVTEQVRALILGGSQEEIEEARNQIHPQDPRANVVEISFAPAYFYNDSDSGYSFRDYASHGPGLGLGANLWFTPFFGLQSRFFTSASASVRSGGTNMVPMDVQTFEAGFRFRKHFGFSRKAARMEWGIDYHDSVNKINSEATTVIGRKSSGLSLSLGAVVPTSVTYAHTFQVDMRPRLTHSESNTGVDVKSGSNSETNAISLSVGGEWTLDRRNQVFWKTQYSVERNLFKGEASIMDPHNDTTPDGVSVTNSLLLFYFGFKWGS